MMIVKHKILLVITGILFLLAFIFWSLAEEPKTITSAVVATNTPQGVSLESSGSPQALALVTNRTELVKVVKVVDGDTIDVDINGQTTRLRLIGLDTPEVVDPRKPVQCFGREASNKAKELLSGQSVGLEIDQSQGESDKYGRLLRYVYLADGRSFNKLMIAEGYAYEYTYNLPYRYQAEYKEAQRSAQQAKRGLWADSTCQGVASPVIDTSSPLTQPQDSNCTIKGNISSTKEKIYHVVGCGSYAKTQIDESKGERWFCSEQEAEAAGWRKAKNCS